MKLQEIRKIENLSQREFCGKYHLNLRTYQNWEQGRSKPPKFVENLINDSFEKEKRLLEIKNIKIVLKYPFKICINKPFLNCDKIYPLQQKKVFQIIEDVKNNKKVKKIIIFGSSVTHMCHQGSDVDIYFELTEDQNPITEPYDFEYDYWDNYRVDETLLSEINNTGVIVYER